MNFTTSGNNKLDMAAIAASPTQNQSNYFDTSFKVSKTPALEPPPRPHRQALCHTLTSLYLSGKCVCGGGGSMGLGLWGIVLLLDLPHRQPRLRDSGAGGNCHSHRVV
ncbi:unnamed protein product [Pleuronectes platessa]|uniref:Uncharacterized protein n=1 Tax=Pleuronectes platessa TaxID=8262 RepID=A0A9N7V6X0_PLEPL|nr:unnamed protein product [Pleuronectes platessa]